MATILSFSVKKNTLLLNLQISKEEYKLLSHEFRDLLLLPSNSKVLNQILTTGKLGNSNRIMVPKKFLERKEVKILDKKVHSQIFKVGDESFLLVKIKSSEEKRPTIKWYTTLTRA